MNIQGHSAIVTGGGSGLGEAVARVCNGHLNGELIHLDGALRMGPR